jgi:hypothetical protein
MTFIDWSDPEEMLGLLCEYVADEQSATENDRARRAFLTDLSNELATLAAEAPNLPLDELIVHLRTLHDAQAEEFRGDDVLTHVEHCIEELERIAR